MKDITKLCRFFLVFGILAFASCDKNEVVTEASPTFVQPTAEASIDYEKPYTQVLTIPKDHYAVGELGTVYTSRDLLYSKIRTQVTLTKTSQRNVARFSMSETDSEYIVTVERIKAPANLAKVAEEICTKDPKELSAWVLEATLAGHTVEICYNEESGMWNGHIVKE